MIDLTEPLTYDEILELMRQKYRELTGFEADAASDIGIRLRVLAEQVAALYARIDKLGRQVFPQTGTGAALEYHAECRGLFRKPARAAEGELKFSRATPAAADIPIPAGLICATRPERQVQFETIADAVLPAGATSVTVAARAVIPGGEGNVAPGAVCLMVSAAPGVTSVTNVGAFYGGRDMEGDEALRLRLLEAYRGVANGVNSAFYYDIAMGHEAVESAAVLPRARGRGTVDVIVRCPGGDEAAAVSELQEEFSRRREINVDVLVTAAVKRPVEIVAAVAAADGYDYETVADSCQLELSAWAADIGVGEPLLLARMLERLLGVEGVYNARIVSPAADMYPGANELIAAGSVLIERLATA